MSNLVAKQVLRPSWTLHPNLRLLTPGSHGLSSWPSGSGDMSYLCCHRGQSTLFPERFDDYVDEYSPVCFIDLFIDGLDISGLGFKTEASDTGRPGYHPRTILKIYV